MKRRNNRNDKPGKPTPYRIERLEQRVLFSADMPFIVDGPATPQPEAIQVLTNSQDRALEQDSATPSRFEVVIIDAGTPDYQSIIDDLQQRSDADFAIYLLDADEGGIAQIDTILAQHQDVSALHLIAHGADGEITLGNTAIDFVDLLADAQTLTGWQDTFTADGDLLIYGCDLAATQGGQYFVETLAQLTGTDVAASNDLTGAAILGGDWQLEYTTGVVETDLALSAQLQSTYQHTLATYTVSTTADSGAGSLHQAIIDANANPNASATDPDRIVFDIGTGPQTIMVAAAGLPIIEESVILDATTQPGYSGTPLITLDGSATPPSSGINGITIRADDTTVKGFIVINFADEGIEVDGSTGFGDNNVVQGNWVGIDKDGNVAGITEHGIMVSVDAHNNQIGGTGSNDGNVVAGNGFSGIILRQNADNNIVEGNTVGLKPDGTTLAANGDHGIFIGQSADNNRIGGTAAGAANIIGGNTLDGIRIDGTTDATYTTAVSGTIVQGNYIGTDITGTLNLANGGNGVHILGGAINSLVGGEDQSAGNLIAFNAANGVNVVNGSNNAVIGNDIHSNTAQGINNNNLMTPPVLAGVTKDSANTAIVKGDINLAANTTYRIEFFSDHYIGFLTVTTDGTGYAGFDEQIAAIVAGGEQISATATVDLGGGNYGDTSELGSGVAAMLNNLTAVDDQYTLTEDAALDSSTTWYDADWSFRRTISFDNSAQAENLTNFPVLIKLDATKIDYAKTHDQGHDLRFFDQNGTQLAHEIESWNEAGTSYVWVHVPQIDASSHTDSILMYYGNATVADSGENSAGVWGEFSATYHLNENPGATGMFADSTGNFDATNSSTTDTAGFIGNAQDFNGTDQHINLGDDRPWINNSSAVTMSIWMNADDVGGYGDLMGISRNDPADTGASRMTLIQNGDNVQVIARTMDDSSDSVSVVTSTSPLVAGQWQQITATVDYASDVDNIKVYVDGKLEQTFSHNFTLDAIPNTDSSHATIGSDEDGVSGFFNGQLDEARISTELRSAEWIAAQHASTTDTFTTFGYEQAAPGLLQNDIDLNGDTLTLTELNGGPVSFGNPTALPSGALLTLFADGSFVYDPNGMFEALADGESATDIFTYTVIDGNGNTDVGTVTMTIDGVNDAPTDLITTATTHGGIDLNSDAGNDTYFVADDGSSILGGLTTVTIETSFSVSTPGADLTPLLSYAAGANDEALGLFLKSDGRIWFGADSNGSPIASTVGNYPQLFDGEVHHVGVSWDSATGNVDFYIDGQLVESITGYQTGHSVAAGGQLVFGQDQDSVLGGFNTIDVFSGTLYDVRIFNDIRTPGEIASNYDLTLPNTEPGMLANWTFNDLSTGGVIVDAVSGNNLTEQHVSALGFSSSNPELSLAVPEDATNGDVIGTLFGIDADAGDTRSYTLLDDAGGRFAIDGASGQITLVDETLIDFESASSHDITVRVTDSGTLTYDEVFTIQVIDVNEAPTFTSTPDTGATEDTLYSYTFTTNDVDGDALNFTGITVPPWLTLVDNGDGTATLSGTPDNSQVGDHTIDVQVSDGALTSNQSFTLTVANVDDAAVITGDVSFSGNEGDVVDGDLDATDDEGLTDGTYFTVSSGATNGTAAIDAETGAWTFTPTDPNWFGSDSFEVTVTDDIGGTTTQIVSITLANVDDSAVITGDVSYSGDEGDVAAGTMSATDVEGLTDTTYFTVSSAATNGTAVINAETGAWTFTPTDPNWFGSDSFEVTVTDDLGGTTTQVVNITLANVNDAPTATNSTVVTNEDTTYVFTATDFNFSDVDSGDTLEHIQITTLEGVGSLKLNGNDVLLNQVISRADIDAGLLTFIPVPEQNGIGFDTFEFKVSDGTSSGSTGVVLNSFAAPAVNSMSGVAFDGTNIWMAGQNADTIYELDTAGNVISSFAAPGTSPTGITFDGTNLWVISRDLDTVYEIDTSGNVLSSFATPGTDSRGMTWDGSHLWLIEGNGSLIHKLTTTGAVVSSVAWPDDYMRDIAWDGTNLWVSDQNDQLVYEIDTSGTVLSSFTAPSTGAAGLTFDGAQFWHADADTDTIFQLAGPNSVAFSAAAYTMTIDVTSVDDAAVITGDVSFSGNEGDVVAGDLNASDVDGLTDTTYFSVSSAATNGTAAIDEETGAWTFTPTDSNWFGSDSFEVTVTDDLGGTTTQIVSITLANVDDAAVITGDVSYSGNEGDAVAGDLNASDVDGLTDTTYFSVSSAATNGTAAIDEETGAWTFTPTDPNWFGSDSFEVTVTDDLGGTTTQVVNITLVNVDDSAVITGDVSYSGNEGDAVAGDLNASDVDGLTDTTYFSVSSGATNGTAAIDAETGAWTFTPSDPNWFGSDSFEVTVTDDLGGTTTQIVSITLANVDDAAVITGDVSYSGNEGDAVSGDLNATDVDGLTDTTYFSVSSAATNGTAAIDAETGAWTFTPSDPNWFGSDSFEVTVTDDLGGTTTQIVSITLANVDDASVITGDVSYSGNEGDAVGGDLNASDVEGLTDTTYFTVTSAATNGTAAIDAETGAWTFTPTDPNWFGSDSFEVTVTDDLGGTTTQVVSITLANVDDAAVITGDVSYSGNEGDAVTGTMSATDVEGLTDTTYFSVTTAATNGTAAIDAETGAWTFTPTDPNWFGSDSFEVTVTDDLGGTTTQVVSITLANVDDTAVITGDVSYSGNEGDVVAGDLDATDVEGLTDTTYFSVSSAATNGTAAIDVETGAWTFTPTDPNWFGSDSFEVTVTDDLGGTTTQVVNITLANVDDSAVITGDVSYSGNEGDTVAGDLDATDVEGLTDTTYFSVSSAATNGTTAIDAETGAWTFTPTDPNWFGSDSFEVTVTDDLGGTTTQVVSITLANVDDTAVITGDVSYSGNEGDVVAGDLDATDVEGLTDTTYFSVSSAATNGTAAIDAETGAWTFTPTDPNWFGSDSFEVTVTDDLGGTTTQVVSITLANVDDAAVITGDVSYSGNEGDAVTGTMSATDVEGLTDTTYFTVTGAATNGTAAIDAETGAWTFTPTDPNWFGSDSFEVTVTDDLGGTTTQVVNITLVNVDDSAAITGDVSYSGNEGDAVAGDLNASDVDGLTDTTYFSVSSGATNGTAAIDAETGAWTFTPSDPNWFGSDSFEVTVTDDLGGTTTQVVNITLVNVDDSAAITGDVSYSGNEGDAVAGDLNASDVDGLTDTTYFSVSSGATNGTAAIDAETGAWTFTPSDPNWFGSDSFEVTVTDDLGGTTTQVVSITLANVDDAAIITGDVSYSGNEGDTVAGDLNATDPEGLTDTTYFTVSSAATNGTAAIDAETGAWTFTPTDPNWFGSDSFEVTVTDDLGATTTQVVSITLANVDDSAVITGDVGYSGNEGDAVAGDLNASDVDGLTDTTYFSVSSAATNGTAAIDAETGAWTFTPTDPNWFGSDSFEVTVTDDLGGTTTQVVSITLANVDDAAIITGDVSYSGNEGDTVAGDLNATDPEGLTDTTYFTVSSAATNGTAAIDAETGAWTFTPTDPNWFGSDSFEVTVTDDLGGTTTQVVSLTVANVNDDPVFSSPNTFNINENATAVGTVTTTDVDGGAPQYTLVGAVDDGLFSIDINTGDLTFDAAPDFEAPADSGGDNVYNLTVQVNDGNGGVVNQAITVNVNNVNETGASAISDTDAATEAVNEDANIGDAVGITAYANDADTGDNILYSLDDDAGGLFTIDANSGVVTVNGVLDYETDTSLDITVRATSTDTSATTRTFTIAIGDVNDNPPVVTPGQVFNINEDAAVNDAVGTAIATDADSVGTLQNWTITAGNTDGIFVIDGNTGAITIADNSNLNFEATNQYTLTVQVGDGVNTSATQTLTINVNDVNEAPTFTSTPDTSATEDSLYSYTFTTNDVEGDPLTFTGITVPPWLTLVDHGNGTATLSGTPTNAEVGGHSIDVQVSDGALTTNQSFTLTVANVNDDPVFSSPNTFNINENATAVGTVTTTDVDGGAPQYTLVGAVDDGLFSIDINTGDLTFDAAPDFEAPADSGGDNVYNLTVQVNDGNGGVVNQAITVNVNNVNETGASAISDTDAATEAVNEDANIGDAVGITAYANDADTGDNILYSLDDDAGGLFTIDANSGVVTVNGVLDYETDTSLDITVRATSTDTSATTRTFTIAIGDVNDNPPVVTPGQVFNINEDAAVNDAVGTAIATDADSVGTLQNWTITAGNTDGIFVIDGNTGAITIADNSNLNFEATNQYTLTVQVGDGVNTSATQTLTINVNDVNEAPTFTSTPDTSATEDSLYSYTFTTNDVEGDPLTFTGITVPPWLTLVDHGNGTATLSGTPTNAEVGGHSIDVQVSDGALTTNQSFTLTVANVNDDPVFSSPNTFNINENATAVGTVTTTDVDGGAPQYTLVGAVDDGLFSIDINTGDLTFDAAPDFEAPADSGGDNVYNLTVQVNDGNGGVVNQAITVNVNNVNETGASAISDTDAATEAVNEDANIGDAVGITAYANDADTGDNILYSLDDDAGGLFTIDANSGVVTVNGVLDYETDTSLDITVRATSTDTSATTRTFTIAIGDVNDNPPVVTPGQVFNINEDAAVNDAVGTAIATDADSVGTLQNWTITAGNTDGIFVIDGNTGAITIADNSNLNFEATNQYTLTVQVGDGVNTSATQTLTINVNDVNEAPNAVNLDNTSVDELSDTSLGLPVGTLAATDPDSGDTFTFAIVGGLDADVFSLGGAQGNQLVLADGVLDFEAQDTYEVTIRSTDAQGLSIDRTFDIAVNDLNDAPQAFTDTLVTAEDVPLTIDVLTDLLSNDLDQDGDQLTVVGITQPTHGIMVNNSDGTWTYSPDANYSGDDQFHYQITDTNGATHQGTVNLVVQAVNDAPTLAVPDDVSVVENSTDSQVQIIASDIENDPVTLSLSGGADRDAFSIDAQSGTLTFAGTPDFENPSDTNHDNRYEVEILVTDSHGASTSQLVSVTVVNVNEAPEIATSPLTSTQQSSGVIGSVTVGDPDVDDQLTLTITGGAGAANFSIDSDTGEIVQNDATSPGMYSLEVQVTDQQGATSQATLNIIVQASTEIPGGPSEQDAQFETSETPDETASSPVIAINEITSEPIAQSNDSTSDEPAMAPEGTTQIATDSLVNKSTFAPTFPQFSEFVLDPPNPITQIDQSTSHRPAYDLILELLLEEADDLAGMAVQYSDLNSQVSIALTPAMLEALEQMRSDIDQQHDSASMQLELITGVGAVTSLSLTAGFVTWLLRTGSLLATALSTTPLWRKFDPIPVLANTNHFSTEGVENSDV